MTGSSPAQREPSPTAAEVERIAELLGRRPMGEFRIAVVTASGDPVVIENAPYMYDSTPMPTSFWLVEPALRKAIDHLEAAGGVKAADTGLDAERIAASHAAYAARRDDAVRRHPLFRPGAPAPSGGVAGTRKGVKCLHAHLAWWLAGGDDPVGEWAAEQIACDRSAYRVVDSADQSGGAP